MKKLLTILSAVGLTAMTATSVVACSTTKQTSDNPQYGYLVNEINQLNAQNKRLDQQILNANDKIDSLKNSIANAQKNEADANAQIANLKKQIEDLKNQQGQNNNRIQQLEKQINNPITLGTLEKGSDLSHFNITLTNNTLKDGDIDASKVTLNSSLPGQTIPKVQKATISSGVLQITLETALTQQWDYENPLGYSINFTLTSNSASNAELGIFMGNSTLLNIEPKTGNSFASTTSVDWGTDNKSFTMSLDQKSSDLTDATLTSDEVGNFSISILGALDDGAKVPAITSVQIKGQQLIVTLDSAMPSSGAYIYNWNLYLKDNTAGIQMGLTGSLALPTVQK